MEVHASGKRLRVPPRKARLVAHEIKGKNAILAAAQLRYHPSKAAHLLRKVLMSAVANAVDTGRLDAEALIVSRIEVDEGFRFKRIKARAQGRANRILKRTSHIKVVLGEGAPYEAKKSNAAPKPRPKFDTKKKAAKKEEPKAEATAVETVEQPVEEVEAVEEAVAEVEGEVIEADAPEVEATKEDLPEEPAESADAEGKQE